MATQDNTSRNEDGLLQPDILEEVPFHTPKKQETSTQSPQPPINRIPIELLIDIFRLVIGKRDSTVIRTLLLVCQQWYNTINNTAYLWSTIAIYPKDFLEDIPRVSKFISTAVEKSLDLPIEVHFDFTHIPVMGFLVGPQDVGQERLKSHLDDLLLRVVGDKGETMRRWRTFIFRINHVLDCLPAFNTILIHPTPNLRELQLHLNLSMEVTNPVQFMSELSTLRTLVLVTKTSPLDFISSANSLQSLSFEVHGIIDLTATLEPFQNLCDLTLNFNWPPLLDHTQVQTVCLPRLERFTLIFDDLFYFPVHLMKMIEMPSLRTLRLLGHPAIDQVLKAQLYTNVHSLHLLTKRSPNVFGEPRRFRKTMTLPFLASRLQHYTALRNLVVARWHLTTAMGALRYLIVKGEAPVALRSVTALIRDCNWGILSDDTVFWTLMTPGREIEDYVYVEHPFTVDKIRSPTTETRKIVIRHSQYF